LNAILLNLKQLVQQSKENKKTKVIGGSNVQDVLKILLHTLSDILEGDGTVQEISNDIWNSPDNSSKQKAVWNEFLSIANGKVVGISAEAEDIVNQLNRGISEKNWIADSRQYSEWASHNISYWVQSLDPDTGRSWKPCVEFLSRTVRLGYTG
jgi:telomere length regulation protein